jgi:hypothetical protein
VNHPRQSDIDRLLKAATKAKLERFAVALREVDGKVEPVLIVDMAAEPPQPTVPRLG